MLNDARITVRVGSDFKARVEKTAEALGMNLTTAITMFLFQMERDKALPFRPSITTARSGIAGLSQGELNAAVKGAVKADRERDAARGLPEARYDAAVNRAFLAYPDGRREYVDGNE
ncbi:MAG: type II toxin-antitoxin system RelB/DinJ family antitoxin [Clostridiales Family XIII bacterium]|jgi:DNA-damage-inducible protein J|nr:type II toxin-antitoxin system RelB/DinJ family antitoxin [Clostridiales Family XIII bacterium]